jgi:CheY-like chemotaxis protein
VARVAGYGTQMNAKLVPRLIAVDDNEDSAELIIRVAKTCGYSTRMMTDTRSLGDMLKRNDADVITLDLSMPDTDGIETLNLLRDAGFHGHLIIISGHRECLREYACEVAKNNGLKVAGHLEKPIRLQALRDLLKSFNVLEGAEGP